MPIDYAKALKWFTLAANQGDLFGIYNLGTMYVDGLGVSQDIEKGFQMMLDAADQGMSGAQLNVAYMFYKGDQVDQNYNKSAHWYRLAALQNNMEAQVALGVHYWNGFGLKQDDVAAYAWFKMAKIQGSKKSASHLESIRPFIPAFKIAAAEILVAKCRESGYKDCGQGENMSAKSKIILEMNEN